MSRELSTAGSGRRMAMFLRSSRRRANHNDQSLVVAGGHSVDSAMRHQRHGRQGDLLPARIAKPDGDFYLRAAANRAIVPGTIVSYVKISCTTTGHQPDPNGDLSLPSGLGFRSAEVVTTFETLVSQYPACYGALLQGSFSAASRRSASSSN